MHVANGCAYRWVDDASIVLRLGGPENTPLTHEGVQGLAGIGEPTVIKRALRATVRLGDVRFGSCFFSDVIGIGDDLLDLLNCSLRLQNTTGDTVGEG